MNITLIGMPGCGKSFFGKKIAERTDRHFIDSDTLLEAKFKQSVGDIVRTLGQVTFLEAQSRVIIDHTNAVDNFILSPGGSIVYDENLMKLLQEVSTVIYLSCDIETLKKRVTETPRIMASVTGKSYEDIFTEREPLYLKWSSANINTAQDSEKVIEQILQCVKK